MRELAFVALWEHFSLDPTTNEWWNTNVVPVTPAPTSGGVTRAGIAAMELLELYQTVRRNPCLYGVLKHKFTVQGVPMCGEFGLSFDEFSAVRKRARAASSKANAQLGRSSWTMAKEVRLASVISALEASVDRTAWKAAAFWQRVATKLCDQDLNWTITAKTAQMRSSQRTKRLAKRGSAVDGLGSQQDTGIGAWAMVESNMVLADSRMSEARRVLDAANFAARNAFSSSLALRRQAAVDIEVTKNALAKASNANRILLLATTTAAAAAEAVTAAVLAAAWAATAVTTAKVEAAAAASAAAEALDVSNKSSVVADGVASAIAKAKDTQRAAACQFVIARDMVTTARDAMSGEPDGVARSC